MDIQIRIRRVSVGAPAGKLADAEVHFGDGVLAGLKLVGFAVWARRDGAGNSVSFPARPFVVHGERRNFALLRAVHDLAAQEPLRKLVLEAYEAEAAKADAGTAGEDQSRLRPATAASSAAVMADVRCVARPSAFSQA